MKLKESKVHFEEDNHIYTLNDKVLMGVTSLMKKHLFANKYDNIPEHILQQAAERGTKIHSLCTLYNVLGEIDNEYIEVANYAQLLKDNDITIIRDEYLVSDNSHFATMIDNVGSDCSLYDIKTTSALDTEYLSWQLSIGAYLFELQNPDLKVPGLYGIWLKNEKAQLVEVPRIDNEQIEALSNAEINGKLYESPFEKDTKRDLDNLIMIESLIAQKQKEIDELEEEKQIYLNAVCNAMQTTRMKKMDNEQISITIVEDRTSKRFDSKKFKEDNADLYAKYQKESTTKGHVKVKLK